MATPPVFTAGSVLTAAQMNAVGLWLVKTQTVGTAVSSVTLTGAFSADYDTYKIVYSSGAGSTNGNLQIQLGTTATNYYGVCIYGPYTSTTITNLPANNASSMSIMGGYDTTFAQLSVELAQPYLAKTTIGTGFIQDQNNQGFSVYRLNNTTSYTDLKIICSTGTITGGTIRVYGYRN